MQDTGTKEGDHMSRTPRKKSSTGIYHVMLRGADRRIIFSDDEDCNRFLGQRHGDGSFVLTEQMMDDMIVTRKVIICPGRREKSQARELDKTRWTRHGDKTRGRFFCLDRANDG